MIPSTIAALHFSLEIVIGMSSLADGQTFNEGFQISSQVPCICVQIFLYFIQRPKLVRPNQGH